MEESKARAGRREPRSAPPEAGAGAGAPSGGAAPSSTRSTCAASPTPTATALGDIGGLRGKLPYLADLGVDAVWITPWYPSPMADGGYDVSDYCDIDPRFGTLADADALLADAHALGLRVIVDLVANHTSGAAPVVRRGAGRGPGLAGAASATSSATARAGRRGAAQRLDQRLRRPGLDPRPGGRRPAGAVVPAPVRPRAARPRLGRTGGARGVRRRPAVLARPRRRRAPGRRGPGHGQGARAARRRARARGAVRVAHLGRQPALGRRRRPRHPPALAGDRGRLRRRPAVRHRGRRPRPRSGSAATCARTRCTPASTSTT